MTTVQEPEIRVMTTELASQIAAGEVVERPASIVKELVENSLDAGAERVEVDIVGGGIDRIIVRDDGHGMGRENLERCLLPHATSKVGSFDDLSNITTFGFRGEALASILSVSRVSVHSRVPAESLGWKWKDGELVPAPRSTGTTFDVRDVFHALPARRRFLKSSSTEWAHITSWITRLSVLRPEVAFVVTRDERVAIDLPARSSVEERMQDLKIGDGSPFYAFESAHPEHGVRLWLQAPQRGAPRSTALLTFVNGRFVQDRTMRAAVSEGLAGVLERGQTPVGILDLQVPPHLVDVNVHPTKVEVRFLHGSRVFSWIQQTLRDFAARSPWVERESRVTIETKPESRPLSTLGGWESVSTLAFQPRMPSTRLAPDWSSALRLKLDRGTPAAAPPESPVPQKRLFTSAFRVIGQWQAKYILIDDGDDLWVIDQHAVHERIRFEQLKKALESGTPVHSQLWLLSVGVPLSAEALGTVELLRRDLELLGWQWELSPDGVQLLGHPSEIDGERAVEVFRELIFGADQHLAEQGQGLHEARDRRHWSLSTQACHGAVRAGDHLTMEAMRGLCQQALELPESAHCPHGRPSWARLTLPEVDRLFHRS